MSYSLQDTECNVTFVYKLRQLQHTCGMIKKPLSRSTKWKIKR